MHPVVTSSPAPYNPLPTKAKIDWATECQTPLTANDDPNKPAPLPAPASIANKDASSSSPAVSDDGPNEPSTPPSSRPPPQQRQVFSSAWTNLPGDFMKMQVTEKPLPGHLSPFQPKGVPVVHSRASSGDTSSISEHPSGAPLQINTSVGPAARANMPFTAAADVRPRFQETLEAERKRIQNISPVKVQVPPINTAVNGEGPRTSPPRERFAQASPEAQRFPTAQEAARYPSLQDQPQQQQQPTYPSIHQGQYQQQPQQGQQAPQQGHPPHRPPPISVNPGQIDFRGGMINDEFMQAPRLPSTAPYPQQARVMSDGGAYPRPGPPPRPAAQYAPHMAYPPYAGMTMGPATPQLYDLSPLPGSPFRAAHQHTTSDPAMAAGIGGMGLRDQMALLQPHLSPAMFNVAGNPLPPQMLYPHQFYGQDAYAAMQRYAGQSPNAAAQAPQPPPSAASFSSSIGSPTQSGGGPSANNRKLGLYKTELCRSWEEKGQCRYGPKCQFAHGEEEIRKVARHPKYKTEICRTFWVSGSCPYGKRCCFIHTELPAPGAPPAAPAGNSPPANPQNAESNASSGTTGATRGRSQSVTSDPTDAPQVSLLTRIQNQRTADAQAVVNANANPNMATPTEGGSTPTFQFPQQRPSSLRVDTATIDTQLSMKQNKSAYPYMNNSIPKNGEHMSLISPGPVTAGPDLGRGASRFDAYERFNKVQTPTSTQPAPAQQQGSGSNSLRHSFNGTESLNLQTQLALAGQTTQQQQQQQAPPASNGTSTGGATTSGLTHTRSESGSNWGNAPGYARSGLSSAIQPTLSWSGDLSVGANRPGSNGSARAQQQQQQ